MKGIDIGKPFVFKEIDSGIAPEGNQGTLSGVLINLVIDVDVRLTTSQNSRAERSV